MNNHNNIKQLTQLKADNEALFGGKSARWRAYLTRTNKSTSNTLQLSLFSDKIDDFLYINSRYIKSLRQFIAEFRDEVFYA